MKISIKDLRIVIWQLQGFSERITPRRESGVEEWAEPSNDPLVDDKFDFGFSDEYFCTITELESGTVSLE